MNSIRKTAIIVNPVSGTLKGNDKLNSILETAKKLGFKSKILMTTKEVGADKLALQEIKKGAKLIIVGGGDGTILEALGVCIEHKISLGVIPLGTGNLFARNLDIPLDISESLKIALGKNTTKIDVGRINGTYFTIMAGVGMDARIMRDASRSMKKKLGMLAYIISAVKNLPKKPSTYEITLDNNKPKTYIAKSILIANMDKIQGGIKLAPHAHPKSGSLKIGIIQAESKLNFLNLIFNSLKGKIHDSQHYTLLTCRKALIQVVGKPLPYQCDGDVFPATDKFEIEVFPKALTVSIP